MKRRFHITQIVPSETVHLFSGYQEVVDTLLWGFAQLGFEASFVPNFVLPGATNIIFGAANAHIESLKVLPRDTIIYNLEQSHYLFLPPVKVETAPHLRISYKYLRENFEFWDYSTKNVDAMLGMESTMPVKHVPIGYAPILQRVPRSEEQDIDILFYGFAHEFRIKVFQELCNHWHKCVFACGTYGRTRDELIARAKLVMNISGGEEESIFPVVRASYLLANRKTVIADVQPRMHIEADMADAVKFAPPAQLAAMCDAFLRDEAARRAAEEKGFEIMAKRDIRAILLAALA